MVKNVLVVFLFFSLFWGGMCWVLFTEKVGIVVGLIAGIVGIFYYSIIVGGTEGERKLKNSSTWKKLNSNPENKKYF